MPARTDVADHTAGLDEGGIGDAAPQDGCDEAARLAAQICGTPIAAVSLVDERRQWFKAIPGLDVTETPREVAFCAHTILQADLRTVPDALNAARFADNTPGTGDPGIRSHVGMPPVTEDEYALGSPCVRDHFPRPLTPDREAILSLLACQAVSHLKSARRLAERERLVAERERLVSEKESLAAIIENSDDAIYRTALDGTLTSWNRGAERLYGYKADVVLGRHVGVLVPDDRQEELSRIMTAVRRGETVPPAGDGTPDTGGRVDVSLRVSSVQDAAGTVIGSFLNTAFAVPGFAATDRGLFGLDLSVIGSGLTTAIVLSFAQAAFAGGAGSPSLRLHEDRGVMRLSCGRDDPAMRTGTRLRACRPSFLPSTGKRRW